MYRHYFFDRHFTSGWPSGWHGHLRGFHRAPSRLLWFIIGASSATLFIAHKEARQIKHYKYGNQCYHAAIQPQPGPDTTGVPSISPDPLPTIPPMNGTPGSPSTPSMYPYSHPHHHSHWGWGFAREKYPPSPPVPYPNSNTNVPSGNTLNRTTQAQEPQESSAPALPTSLPGSPSGAVETQGQTPVPALGPASVPSVPASVPWGFENKFEQQRLQWEQDKVKLIAKAQDAMTELSESTLESLSSTLEALKAKLAAYKAEREAQQKLLDQQLEEQKKKPVRFV